MMRSVVLEMGAVVCFLFQSLVTAQAETVAEVQVEYLTNMLLVSGDEGTGAVRFLAPRERKSGSGERVVEVEYHWRFVAAGESEEQSGRGKLYAKMVSDRPTKGLNSVRCGPLKLVWEPDSQRFGRILLSNGSLRVMPVVVGEFGAIGDEKARRNPINLAELQVGNVQRNLAAGICYGKTVLLVRRPEGLALFWLDSAYEEQVSEKEKHHGVKYRSQFVAAGSESPIDQTGKAYEQYIDDQYKGGELELKAGPIEITWSVGGKERGWIYYLDGESEVWTASVAGEEKLKAFLSKQLR